MLLDKGANAAVQDRTGWTPLHWAMLDGWLDALPLLTDPVSTIQDRKGLTALHWAAFLGQEEVVKLLAENDALVGMKGIRGLTALHLAALEGFEIAAKLLLAKGADIMARDEIGWTVLHWATLGRRENVVKLLLEKGADLEAEDEDGLTALHVATLRTTRGYRSNSQIAAVLHRTAGTQYRTLARMEDLTTHIHLAAADRLDVVAELRIETNEDEPAEKTGVGNENKADKEENTDDEHSISDSSISIYNKSGEEGKQKLVEKRKLSKPIAEERDENVVRRLLESGANIDLRYGNGRTALYSVACEGNEAFVPLLLQKGADVDAKDDDGRTALLGAADFGNTSIVKLLIEKGADVSIQDASGVTAFQIAAMHGYQDIAILNRSKGDSNIASS